MKNASCLSALLAAAFLPSCAHSGGELRPFSSEGCTLFPEGTISSPCEWHHHCVEHDFAYWAGGSYAERLAADRTLRERLREDGHPVVGTVMYLGVRAGGSPFFPTPWRWGYGWKGFRGYLPLTQEERRRTREQAPDRWVPPPGTPNSQPGSCATRR